MRIFIMEQETDLAALASSLARTPRAATATLERVKALNPQLADAASVPKGGVVIVPDGPEIKAGAGVNVGAISVDDIADNFGAGTRAQVSRAASRLELLTSSRAEVRDALKNAAAKRLVEADPLLQKRLAAADAQFKAEQKLATEARSKIADLTQAAQTEFARVRNLLG